MNEQVSLSPNSLVNRALPAVIAVALIGSSVLAQAADFYRIGTMLYNSQHWNQSGWWSSTPGGSSIGTFDPNGHYFNDSADPLRTGGSAVLGFEGASLTMVGGTLSMRRNETPTIVPNLIIGAGGANVTNDYGGTAQLHANILTLNGDFSTGPQGNDRTIWLTADSVLGAGNVTNGQGSGLHGTRIGFGDASLWTGNIVHNWGVLDFSSSLSTAGGLIVNTAESPTISLTETLSFSSVTLGETSLAAGTYSFAELSASYGSIFTAGDINGSLTVVPEPSTFALIGGLFAVGLTVTRRRRLEA